MRNGVGTTELRSEHEQAGGEWRERPSQVVPTFSQ